MDMFLIAFTPTDALQKHLYSPQFSIEEVIILGFSKISTDCIDM